MKLEIHSESKKDFQSELSIPTIIIRKVSFKTNKLERGMERKKCRKIEKKQHNRNTHFTYRFFFASNPCKLRGWGLGNPRQLNIR